MLCEFKREGQGGIKCIRCGRELASQHERIQAKCGTETTLLGDQVEGILKGIGITQERYQQAKQLFGLPPTCNCQGRKAWLNKVSRWWRGQGHN